jgi:hypothetical protein
MDEKNIKGQDTWIQKALIIFVRVFFIMMLSGFKTVVFALLYLLFSEIIGYVPTAMGENGFRIFLIFYIYTFFVDYYVVIHKDAEKSINIDK